MTSPLFTYTLRVADDHLILGQRLSEWCGHAPTLEEDIGLANIALDMIGQARALYAHAAELEGQGRNEDQLAFLRTERRYLNVLLVEQPNVDFAVTIMRQLMFSAFMEPFWTALSRTSDKSLAGIAAKAVKEAQYHVRHAAEWAIRLGDGTEESHRRSQAALGRLWPFTGELFEDDDVTEQLSAEGTAVLAARLRPAWDATIDHVLQEATLQRPDSDWMQTGGRTGRHSEHLGHLLCELQYMQRTYPGLQW